MTVVQLTDTHISSELDTARWLRDCTAFVNAMRPQPSAVCVTGDLTDAGRPEEYAAFRTIVGAVRAPVYVVPGNHDRREALRAQLPARWLPGTSSGRVRYAVQAGALRIIALDSSEPRRPGGTLDAETLAWFDAELAAEPHRPALVMLHHPPFRTGIRMADLFGFEGLGTFRAIVERRHVIRAIISGHVHCTRTAAIGGTPASSTGSTAPQLVPELFERRPVWLRRERGGLAVHRWTGETFATARYVNDGAGRFTPA